MDLPRLAERLDGVSARYAAAYGIDRTADWHLLKVHEEVGELTQAVLMADGQARAKGLSQAERDAAVGAEIADVFCQLLLLARHRGVDLDAEIDGKWLVWEADSGSD
ncbi:nucleoside triphosphate pyrophosphohydrolase family protein [Nocardiopsis coralliicola]